MSTDIATNNKKKLVTLLGSPSIKNRLNEILGKRSSTFATSVVQIQQSNKLLEEATPESIIGAAMTAATLNLPLNNQLGHAYIVPFREKQSDKTYLTKAQFMLGYKGLKQLCTRSGQFKFNNARDVREGEVKYFDYLTGEIDFEWEQDYAKRQKLNVVGYVHFYELINGYKSTKFMTVDEIKNHAKKYSQTYKKGFGNWKDDFESMALKTVTKLHLNDGSAPLTIEMQKGIETDQATIDLNEDGSEETTYIDNQPAPEVNHDFERQKILVENIETIDDLELAESHVDHPTLLPVLKAKRVALEKRDTNNKKKSD